MLSSQSRADVKNQHQASITSAFGGTSPLRGQAERAGAVQPGEEKAPERPYSNLPGPEGAYRKAGEGLFIGAGSDQMALNWKRVDLD